MQCHFNIDYLEYINYMYQTSIAYKIATNYPMVQ